MAYLSVITDHWFLSSAVQLLEMLEYAGRDGGVVDLAAFTAVLAEAL